MFVYDPPPPFLFQLSPGVERLFSIAGHILSSRRTILTDKNYDSFLFANVNFDLYDTPAGNKLKI